MNAKQLFISAHAEFEMRRRGINRRQVTAVVYQPGQIVPSDRGRQIRQSLTGFRGQFLLRVVVKETGTAYHVVTAYKTSKIGKYWIKS